MVMEPSLQSIGVQWFGGDQEMERVVVNYGDAPGAFYCGDGVTTFGRLFDEMRR